MLRKLPHLGDPRLGAQQRRVKRNHPWVVVLHPAYGARPESQYDPDHAGLRVEVVLPDERVVGESDPGQIGKEIMLAVGAGDALYEKGHLFVMLVQAALDAVGQRILIHRTGKDPSDVFLEMAGSALRATPG